MKKINKITLLTGLAATATAITPVVALTSCQHPTTPEQTDPIVWKDGWYAYHTKENLGTLYSDEIYVEFTLANALESGETLSYEIINETGTTDCSLVGGTINVSGTKVVIPVKMKTTQTIMYIGDYRQYSVKFTFTKTGSDPKTVTVNDCYFVMLTDLNAPMLAREAYTSGYEADLETMTTVNVPTSLVGTKIKFNAEVVTTERSSGVPSTTSVEVFDTPGYKSQRHLYAKIRWSENPSGKVAAGEYMKFKVKFTLSLTDYPQLVVPFEFENLTFAYKP